MQEQICSERDLGTVGGFEVLVEGPVCCGEGMLVGKTLEFKT